MTDPLEDIQEHIEKQTPVNHTYTHKEQFKKCSNGTHTSDTQQESMTTNLRGNSSQTNRRVNNGKNNTVNSMPLNINVKEPSQENVTNTRTRYRRII